ncbi:MAG TPA: NUDIX hydrolase [Burkholderiales bacterium]|jgi:ADP-ribose pyrophosphatase YjhB (NUDIX family)
MREVWRPSVTVAAVIERDGKFLLVEEMIDGRKVINQPAGHLDPGESLAAACAREVLEETAHRFEPTGLVGVYRWHYEPKDVTFLRFCFRGKLLGQENRALDKEIIGLLWLTRDQVKASAAARSPLVLRCIDDYEAGRNYPLDVFSKEFS